MRVFVLCTGRCGSVTLSKACSHIENYTTGHETNISRTMGRLIYPDWHIEIDNRLAWFLGSLYKAYGDDAVYVHLARESKKVAESYSERFGVAGGIMTGFGSGILFRRNTKVNERTTVAQLYTKTVNDNIDQFLQERKKTVRIRIEAPHEGFEELWHLIGARGDKVAAHAELDRLYNVRKKR